MRLAETTAPTLARHEVLAGSKASAGPSSLLSLQNSATSQVPTEGRHSLVRLAPSTGQAVLDPVNCSARPQTPSEARHSVPAARGVNPSSKKLS